MKKLLLCFLIGQLGFLNAQIVLNEISPTNKELIMDEDLEYPDWIEIYNAGPTGVNLSGYGITDNSDVWNKWEIGSKDLAPNEHLIIYASGKNRNCNTCELALINHWETAIFDDDTWEYFIGASEPVANWNNLDFAGVWSTGPGGFGFGDFDDNTTIPVSARSVYYRKTFNVIDKTKLIATVLSMDFDDGFVAYLNGVEIARQNMTGIPTYSTFATASHEALMYVGGNPTTFELDPILIETILMNGENVLAIQVHNQSTGSSDMTGRSFLHFGISTIDEFYYDTPGWFGMGGTSENLHTNFKVSSGETISLYDNGGVFLDSVTVPDLQVAHSLARISDGGDWCIVETPTPENINTGICYSEYATNPIIITPVGFYDDEVDVTISGTGVYYTTDGSSPTELSDNYISPINVDQTTTIKARRFEAGKLPSAVVTGSFLIDEATTLPVISISGDPCDLFDEGADCIAAYDNAIGWEPDNPQVPVTIEFFEADKTHKFTSDVRFEVCGNSSIYYNEQRSIEFTCDEEFYNKGNIEYNLFYDDKPVLETLKGFRIRQQDQDATGARMKDVIGNRIGLPTYNVAAGYQNVAAFINGEYWGHYCAREELDQYFISDNFGCDADQIDLVRTGYGADVWFEVESGTDTAFFNLVDFITLNDMTDPTYYEAALNKIDMLNWVDYFALQIFIENGEWLDLLENNIRIFKSYAPDMKWKYILWDLTYGQSCANCNTLQGSLENPHNSLYCDMFNAMLENDEFENYFINRFADLINYYFTAEISSELIDANKAEIESEIPAQNSRWYTGSLATWNTNVTNLKNFYANRIPNQRNHIETYFGLNDQIDVTINVNPPGAGYIKISTLIPQELPWTGVYFDGVPVTLTAIANPGFAFVDWDDNIFITDESMITFTNNFTDNTSFTANFTGAAIANPIIVSEINYNSDITTNSGDWIELHNNSDVPVTLTDYVLSTRLFYNSFRFPDNTIIPAHGYLVVVENSELFIEQNPGVDNYIGNFIFDLENSGDSIVLKDHSGITITNIKFDDVKPWPVTADNFGRTMERTTPADDPNLANSWFDGCMGGSAGEAYTPCNENPLVTEINYHSLETQNAGDWFEIHNFHPFEFDMSGWTIKDKNDNTFIIPDETFIDINGYLVIYQDETLFFEQFPTVNNKTGPTFFGLNNEDDIIRIYDENGILYQSVHYYNQFPFPLSADGGGNALQIVDITKNINDATNWMESCPEGTPGTLFVSPCAVTIAEENIAQQIRVFPNPASNTITIILPEAYISKNINIALFDLTGKEMISVNNAAYQNQQLDVSIIPAGLYLLQISSGENKMITTLIKQ
jgi:hypothetical protein